MDLGISNRTALVLAGGGGIGGAIALSLASEGVSVAIADINADAAEATANAVLKMGGKAIALKWDLAETDAIDAHVSVVEEKLGPIDILINNTGGPPPTPVSGQPASSWRQHFESMVVSVIGITDRVLPNMREAKWGRIITSTSSGVVAPIQNLGMSNALRISLVGWSKTLAREIAKDGITSNIVVPGRIATNRTKSLDAARAEREGKTIEEIEALSSATIPIGRYGEPKEYADVVTFLASDRASFVTGSVVRIDGGMIASV